MGKRPFGFDRSTAGVEEATKKGAVACFANSRNSGEGFGKLYSTPTTQNCIICAALARSGTLNTRGHASEHVATARPHTSVGWPREDIGVRM
jgi:hypothetical protein